MTVLLEFEFELDTVIINTFKNILDAHWKHRYFLFHYRATYTGTAD